MRRAMRRDMNDPVQEKEATSMSDPDYVGGFVLIPKSRGLQAFGEAARAFYQQVGCPGTDITEDPVTGRGVRVTVPEDTFAARVAQYGRNSAFFDIEGIHCYVGFNTLVSFYYSIEISAHHRTFEDTQETFSREQMQRFARTWSQLCEAVEAEYGYFNLLSSFIEDEFRDEEIILPLAQRDMEYLVRSAEDNHSLSYLGPELVAVMTPPLWEILEETEVKRMPSGALFITRREAPFYY